MNGTHSVIPKNTTTRTFFLTTQKKLAAFANLPPRVFSTIKNNNTASIHMLQVLQKFTCIKQATWTSPDCKSALERELKKIFRAQLERENKHVASIADNIPSDMMYLNHCRKCGQKNTLPKRLYITNNKKLAALVNITRQELSIIKAYSGANKEQSELLAELTHINKAMWAGPNPRYIVCPELDSFFMKEKDAEIKALHSIGAKLLHSLHTEEY